jgi:hypothetical protein
MGRGVTQDHPCPLEHKLDRSSIQGVRVRTGVDVGCAGGEGSK